MPCCISSNLVSRNGLVNFVHNLNLKPRKRLTSLRAVSDNVNNTQPPISSPEQKNALSVVLDIPKTIWRQTLRPLSDFGFGRRSIWEGGVGLFLVSGTVLFVLCLAWLKGFQLRSKFRKYLAVFEFSQACGISYGTPVRIRGVTVGNVIQVNPSLKSIEAVVESGLLMETMIDIIPRNPIPTPTVGPLHAECRNEGLILCDRQKIKGIQGVSLDALVGIFTRLGRDVEEIGVANTYALAVKAAAVIEEAKPLLTQIKAMAEDVQPLLSEIRESGLLTEVESLTKSLTKATGDLRSVHSSIMTPETAELIQKSIYTLIFTLKNIAV
ncbi:hypothetical protein AgCh_010486 [Apium graveolens]